MMFFDNVNPIPAPSFLVVKNGSKILSSISVSIPELNFRECSEPKHIFPFRFHYVCATLFANE